MEIDESDLSFESLLPKAVAKPRLVSTDSGGATLVVALHCLLVKEGFQRTYRHGPMPVSSSPLKSVLRLLRSPYYLEGSFRGDEDNTWLLEYTRRDAPGLFVLQCSLAKGMMIVCGAEVDNPDNCNMLSLRVSKYVPELARCRQTRWEGVFDNGAALAEMFLAAVARHLIAASYPAQGPKLSPKPKVTVDIFSFGTHKS
uniref:Uncharacterized protein n=1 Tax=Tetraselmis sp. GSL018 TaxID=582737 RepID=A0A061R0Z6_9CHLO